MRRTPIVIGLVGALGLGGYAVADAYDLVPGIITLAPAAAASSASAAPTPSSSAVIPVAAPAPTLKAAARAPIPTAAGLAAALDPVVADQRLGGSVGASVRDAVTGKELYAVGASTPRTPASLVKLLAAAVIVDTIPAEPTSVTRVWVDKTSGTVTLVAGGDLLLAAGKGKASAVVGRVGIADLAEDTVTFLKAAGLDTVALRIDDTFASGEARPKGWENADYTSGSAVPITMIGLAKDRPEPGVPAVSDPAMNALTAFGKALSSRGITVKGAPTQAVGELSGDEVSARRGAALHDVLAYALEESDNALIESLVRMTTYLANEPAPTVTDAAGFVSKRLPELGISISGLDIKDTSGLTRGQQATTRTISEVLALAASDRLPPLRSLLADLPISGLSGTLDKRFAGPDGEAVRGIPRAKTGTLIGTSNLAGWTVTQDGRPLLFTVLADHTGGWEGTEPARAALDRFAAVLTECGCR